MRASDSNGVRLRRWTVVASALAWSASASAAIEGPPRPLTEPRQIESPSRANAAALPIDDLFYARGSFDGALAPDGSELVISTNLTGRYNLWRVPVAGGFPAQLTRSDERQWGMVYSPDGKTVVFESDRAGAEMFDLYAVPRDGGTPVNLTSTDDATESHVAFSSDGRWLAFGRRAKTGASANVALMEVASRQVRLLTDEKSPEMQWTVIGFSPDGKEIIANRADIVGTQATLWRIDATTGAARPAIRKPTSRLNLAADMSRDGRWWSLTVETRDGRRQAALYDTTSERVTMLHPDPWEQHAGRFAPDGGSVLFVSNVDGRDVVYRYDIAKARAEELPLPAGGNGDYFGKLPAFTADGRSIVFPHQSGTRTIDYWSFDLQSRQATQITRLGLASIGADALPPTQIVRYRSSDGTIISALLWTPFNAARDGSSPAVVLAHGGPTGQTQDRFDTDAVALASRGYFVIAPNPRGSTGYGKAFVEANRRDLGGGDLQDYVAGARFLADTGYVDSRRIGITGTSYGGFMTIMALGRTPDVFAAGVEICGITNWFSMYERGSPALRAYQVGLLGDPVKDRSVYEASSPLTYLKQVKAPLLALQGDMDIRVPKYEAEQVVATLRSLGRTVDAAYYAEEGHGFFKRENQIDALQRTVAWFDKHMPRRVDDLASMNWLEGPKEPRALDWARAQTRRSQEEITKKAEYSTILTELQATLKASAPSPEITLLGSKLVRFTRTTENRHGLLQVADRAASGGAGEWRTVLDVDALRKTEGKPYELQWFSAADGCLPPAYDRCILRLSPGGADEVELREFDLRAGRFVEEGFRAPASRAFAVWLDADHVLISHTLLGSAQTAAGWGAVVRIWKRGEDLGAAKAVLQAQPTDAIVQLSAVGQGAARRGVVQRVIDYSTFEMSLVAADGTVTKVDLPQRLKPFGLLTSTARHLIVQLAADADIGGRRLPAETVLAYDTTASASDRGSVQVVYTPREGEYLNDPFGGIAATRNAVHFVVMRKLVPHLISAEIGPDGWVAREQFTAEAGQSLRLSGGSAGADVIVQTTGFLTPTRHELWRPGSQRTLLQAETPVVDASRFVVEIRSAASKDGTSIDYYLLRPRNLSGGSPTPTLMTGYGAFGLSMTPGYFDYIVGGRSFKVWLDRGGALALPAIRGGGERGGSWHRIAMREGRQVSYDDFAAVAASLVQSGFTTPSQLGVFGTSNGGLLAATMGTQRPDLFGAVVSDVPLADMLRFPKMGMGAAWMDEYGNPDDAAAADVLRSYSPVHNVREGRRYPPFLVTISTEDNRVGPGHARKLAARLLDAGAPVYFLEDEEGGHGVSDALARPEIMAARMTFLIDALMRNELRPE